MYNYQLDTFISVADTGSFGKAAEQVHVSPTAVIQQINLLEERCGVQLFDRTHHGVSLTPAGKSMYEDAKTIIKLSKDAVMRAKNLADKSEHTVRVGTSLLFKCRMIPDIWAKVSRKLPDLKIEILPIKEYRTEAEAFAALGTEYDIHEGIWCSISQKDMCSFLELMRTPFCCAVSKTHPYAGRKILTIKDLNNQYIVTPPAGISKEHDEFRRTVQEQSPGVHIVESAYYGMDTFTLCEMMPYILITQPVYKDIHPNLVTIPLETDLTLPYGLIYAKNPSAATRKFIAEASKR